MIDLGLLCARRSMNDEKLRQVREWQREEGMIYVALAIFHGSWPYEKFLSTNPTPEEKKYVDGWLRANLVGENKNKIIPGFND